MPSSAETASTSTAAIATSNYDISFNTVTDDVSSGTEGERDIALLTMRIAVIIVGLIGMLDNGVVLWVIYRVAAVRKSMGNLYLINQCVVDLLCSFSLVFTYAAFLAVDTFEGYWGLVLCKAVFSESVIWSLYSLSNFSLVMINVDRYITIVHPKKRYIWGSKKIKWTCLVASWLLAFGVGLPVVVVTTDVVDKVCIPSFSWPSYDSALAWGYLVFAMAPVSLLVFSFVYIRIYIVVRKSKMAVASNATDVHSDVISSVESDQQKQSKKLSKEEREVLKSLVLVSLAYAICVTPVNIYYLLYNVGYNLNFSNGFYFFLLAVSMANCATNPFVYMAKLKTLRSAVKSLLNCGP